MTHWNTKKRQDDRRGYKTWSKESKAKVRKSSMRYPQLNDRSWLEQQYIALGKTTVQIAQEVGCVNSTVFHALRVLGIPRIRNYRGRKHHLWRGGSGFRGDERYAEWRLMVYGRDNYTCQLCGARGVYLNAHHVLPCRDYPDLIYSVDNGVTLCESCHRKTFNREDKFRFLRKDGELLENPERIISSQAVVGISQKVQRLEGESRTDSNPSTSAVPEKDDIVRSLRERKEV